MEIRGKGQTFLLCCTYRSEWSGVEYYTRLIHAIELGYQYTENIVISEDLNSDLFSYNNNKLYDIIHQFNLKNVINKPTRVTDHSSTLLDPIILSDAIQFSFSDVLNVPANISDHDASVIFFTMSKVRNKVV